MSNVADPLERANVPSDLTFGKNVEFSNCIYTGQLSDGFRHGVGRSMGEKDSFTYTGNYMNNIRHGFGVFVNKLNNSYSGRFKNGNMHEGGVVTTMGGDRYEVEYNQGVLIFSQKVTSAGNMKLASIADKGWEREKEVAKMIRDGGVVKAPPKSSSMAKASKAKNQRPRQEAPRQETPRQETPRQETPRQETPRQETFSEATATIEMFGDDEEEPIARPATKSNSVTKNEEVQYADPSELCILPAQIAERMDYHWDELQSSEAAKFLTAYGTEGTFLVRTRPMTNNETALAALLNGTVHHFKFETLDGLHMMGGVKKKTIPLLIAYFFKHCIYKRNCLREPLPPYIDIIKKLEALGHSTGVATKAFKATKSYDTKVLQQWIQDKGL